MTAGSALLAAIPLCREAESTRLLQCTADSNMFVLTTCKEGNEYGLPSVLTRVTRSTLFIARSSFELSKPTGSDWRQLSDKIISLKNYVSRTAETASGMGILKRHVALLIGKVLVVVTRLNKSVTSDMPD